MRNRGDWCGDAFYYNLKAHGGSRGGQTARDDAKAEAEQARAGPRARRARARARGAGAVIRIRRRVYAPAA